MAKNSRFFSVTRALAGFCLVSAVVLGMQWQGSIESLVFEGKTAIPSTANNIINILGVNGSIVNPGVSSLSMDGGFIVDSNGDAIVAFQYTGDGQDIYEQKMDLVNGDVTWGSAGIPVQAIGNAQSLPTIIPDGTSNGAIIAWLEGNTGWANIRVQRVNATGDKQWASEGVRILDGGWDAATFSAIPDGQGGAVIAWLDQRAGTDIYVQRVNSAGSLQWQANGLPICNVPSEQGKPELASDGSGGAVITWLDRRGGNWDVYAQRVTAGGATSWLANGTAICTQAGTQQKVKIARCGMGKWAVAWTDYRSDMDIYTQVINATGTPLLATDGIPVCNASEFQDELAMVSYDDGVVIAWKDDRYMVSQDIFIQRMNASGEMAWPNGTWVIAQPTSVWNQDMVVVDVDTAGSMYCAWRDNRDGNFDVFYQKLFRNGTLAYNTLGHPVCAQPGEQVIDQITCDGAGGAYIGFLGQDDAGVNRYRLQHVLMNVAPVLSSPVDVSAVVGEQAFLRWTATDATVNLTSHSFTCNASAAAIGLWTSGAQISVQLNTTTEGVSEYMIVVSDGYGLQATDIVLVTIVPNNTPVIVTIVILCAIGGGVVFLYVLDKKKIINLKHLFGKIRGVFIKSPTRT